MYSSFVEKCLPFHATGNRTTACTGCPGKGTWGLHLLPVKGLSAYANDFWVKGKAGCGIFSANVNRSTEIEDNLCLLRCLK